jgi:hypothetical protein
VDIVNHTNTLVSHMIGIVEKFAVVRCPYARPFKADRGDFGPDNSVPRLELRVRAFDKLEPSRFRNCQYNVGSCHGIPLGHLAGEE